MKRRTFKILFFLKKNNVLKNGEVPVCMRITVNGIARDLLIKWSIAVEQWNQAKECAKGKGRYIEELNRYIESIRVKLYQISRELEESGKIVTADKIKNIYLGNDTSQKTLLQIFEEHNNKCRKLIGKDFTDKTVQRYETTQRYLKEFIKNEYRLSDIILNEITPSFIHNFEVFLKVEKQCAQNAMITRMKNLKKIIRIALENDQIKKNPFIGIRFKLDETNPEFLTMAEIQIIISKEMSIKRIEQVKDIFLFCCFTGLAFSDVQQLSLEHIIKGNGGEIWIRKARQKTKNMCNIPLLPIPASLIDKYKAHPESIKNGKIFPVPSNQKYNSYLKEISDICRINKHLTSHVARHSYATSVCLANGVSMENVAKMLGHSDTTITKHYARVLDSSILRDMKNVEQVFSNSNNEAV